jgi:hypothetical protein
MGLIKRFWGNKFLFGYLFIIKFVILSVASLLMNQHPNSGSADVLPASIPPPIPADRRRLKDRRRRPTPMISRYLFIGSRRVNRRWEDRQGGYYVDRPCRELITLALLIILLGVLDAILTLKLLRAGGVELNPLMNLCLSWGWGYCLLLKFALTGLGLFVLVLHQNFFRMQRIVSSVGVFYGLLIIYQAFLLIQT